MEDWVELPSSPAFLGTAERSHFGFTKVKPSPHPDWKSWDVWISLGTRKKSSDASSSHAAGVMVVQSELFCRQIQPFLTLKKLNSLLPPTVSSGAWELTASAASPGLCPCFNYKMPVWIPAVEPLCKHLWLTSLAMSLHTGALMLITGLCCSRLDWEGLCNYKTEH